MVAERERVGTVAQVRAEASDIVAAHTARWSEAPEIVWLGEPAAEARMLVGGKVSPLSRLAARYRVPPGFCLTTNAYDAAHAQSGEYPTNQPDGLVLPQRLRQQIAAAYARLAEMTGRAEPAVAVRSSAVDEDGVGTSFAGQHDTYLNVVGTDAVCDAVVRCWASAVAPRALDYRRQHGLSTEHPRIAVLVQQLVVADASGVAFSANPITGRRDEVVINVSWGLGESVVGGSVTPDSYVVRAPGRPARIRGDWSVAERAVAQKRRMTVAVPGGTREVDVPRMLQATPSLEDVQLIALAGLAHDLEQTMGWPVDLECAFRDDVLYLLQCRPITTLTTVTP